MRWQVTISNSLMVPHIAFFTFLLILSADYEEQYAPLCSICVMLMCFISRCVMALIRGTKGLCPCPVCLVPHKALHALNEEYPRWTAEDSRNTVKLARATKSTKDADKLLKSKGLRGINVCLYLFDPSLLVQLIIDYSFRMHSGNCLILTLTECYHMMSCTLMTLEWVVRISSPI